ISHGQSTKISNRLTDYKFAVLIQPWLNFVAIELFDYAVSPLFELLKVVLGPPHCQISVGIKPGAGIVEAVCHFMTNDNADAPLFESFVGLRTLKRQWQNVR